MAMLSLYDTVYVGAGFFFCTCNKDDTEKSNNTGPKSEASDGAKKTKENKNCDFVFLRLSARERARELP